MIPSLVHSSHQYDITSETALKSQQAQHRDRQSDTIRALVRRGLVGEIPALQNYGLQCSICANRFSNDFLETFAQLLHARVIRICLSTL